jgi:uncharacterized protein YbjT (DUF2867 family)
MKIIVTGATGLVGAEVIRQAIQDRNVTGITALSRKPIDIVDQKLTTIIHNDFLDYSSLSELFKKADACIWCLGVSQSQVSKEQYHTITYDYAIKAANAMLYTNPQIRFVFVSGGGADSTEQSKTLFARVKGKTENALKKLPFKSLVIARPGGIKPVNPNPNAPFIYKLMYPLFPIVEWIAPSTVISSVDLAKALLHLARTGSETTILENVALKAIGKNQREGVPHPHG